MGCMMKKGLGRGEDSLEGKQSGGPRQQEPHPGIPNPGAQRSGLLRSRRCPLGAGRTRTRTAATLPPPARRRLPRAAPPRRPLPCASPPFATCRMVRRQLQRRVGGGGGGEGRRCPGLEEGPRRAGRGKLGKGLAGGPLGGRSLPSLPPSPPPGLRRSPYFKAIPASPVFSCSDVQEPSRPRGVFLRVVPSPKPRTQTQERTSFCPLSLFPSRPHSQAFV